MDNVTSEERAEAIDKSIKHWTKDAHDLKLFSGGYNFLEVFSSGDCACCDNYGAKWEGCDADCPMIGEDGLVCDAPHSLWLRARDAANDLSQKRIFLFIRKLIIERLEQAKQ